MVAPPLSSRLRRILVTTVIAVALLLGLAYAFRQTLVRAYIVMRVHRMHLFSPASSGGRWTEAKFLWDVVQLRTQRDARSRRFEPQLKPLVEQISKRQSQGENLACSVQIYREVRWWINFTADETHTPQRLADLAASLARGVDQSVGQEQSPDDGSWGAGYTVWFMKLYGSVNDALANHAVPRYPMRFLEQINSPEKLTAHMNEILHDNFLATRMINRQELDETASALARLLMGDVRTNYPFHPELKRAFGKFIDDWQNPVTGCWGVWFVGRDGTVWRQDDVGITFHIVSDYDGNVKHLDQIVRRVLELRSVDFPAGIRMHGRYENHLNWDVVKIFRYAWPALDENTRRAAQAEMSRMLTWCLAESYQPDGTFKVSELDDTTGDAMQYGVNFLREVGFFRKSERFWTQQEFPQAKAIHAQIKARLEAMGHRGAELSRAFRHLGDKVN